MPGCDGAKVMKTVQVVLPGRVAGQSVVSVKSPVRVRARAKGCGAGVADGDGLGGGGVLVTRTGVGKVRVVGRDGEVGVDGLRRCRWAGEGCLPVTRTVRPWSSVRVVASAEGAVVEW